MNRGRRGGCFNDLCHWLWVFPVAWQTEWIVQAKASSMSNGMKNSKAKVGLPVSLVTWGPWIVFAWNCVWMEPFTGNKSSPLALCIRREKKNRENLKLMIPDSLIPQVGSQTGWRIQKRSWVFPAVAWRNESKNSEVEVVFPRSWVTETKWGIPKRKWKGSPRSAVTTS